MKKKRLYWILLPVFTVILAMVVGIGIKTDVFGMFTPQEPYVTGEPESMSSVVVTDVGKNWQDELGTGVEPCSEEVPTCSGKKGSETNPFVVLEIVADKAQQQMTYLAADDDSQAPLDIMQIGIDLAAKEGKSYVPGSSAYMQRDILKSVGQWFANWEYEVKKIGGDGETEKIHYVDVGKKLYSLKITDDDLKEAGILAEEFATQFNSGKTQKFSRQLYDIPSLIKKYPSLFEKDDDGKEIRSIAKKDINNWGASYERKVVKEAVFEEYKGKGFIMAVEPGEGDFGFASEEDCRNWRFTKTGTNADRWKYVENEEDIPEEYRTAYEKNDARLYNYGFYYISKGINYGQQQELYTKYNDSAVITGLYMNLSDGSNSWRTYRYDIEPEETKDVYTFDYYGISNKNVLKRQLFIFNNQKQYDDFHMKVICMTPSELNAMAKKDTDETADMIERADMFYIGSYDSATNNIENVYKLYYEYVLGKTDYDSEKVKSLADDDLEWDLCYKLIYRLCNNKNLPLVMTNKLTHDAISPVPMYHSEKYPRVDYKGDINNFAKLYIIATQFDLTAKKSEDESFIRTFYDDILLPGKIQKIALGDGAKNKSDSPAQYTGYYERPKVIVSDDEAERNRCYYVWNTLTFFPEALEGLWYNQDQVAINKDDFVAYGYMRSYFDTNDPSNLFSAGGGRNQANRVHGSDGTVGNVTLPFNGVNDNYATLLGNTESADVTNGAMNRAFLIMNNRPEVINPQVVKVMKQKREYVKMSDTAVLLDYSSDKSYGEKKSYIKVQIHNNNNGEAGLVTKITLKNSDGEKAPKDASLALYTSKDGVQECEKATFSTYTGYKIPETDTLIAYVPYSLQQWADGYNVIEFETVGRIYSKKKKKILTGTPVTTSVSIGERTLFNLE